MGRINLPTQLLERTFPFTIDTSHQRFLKLSYRGEEETKSINRHLQCAFRKHSFWFWPWINFSSIVRSFDRRLYVLRLMNASAGCVWNSLEKNFRLRDRKQFSSSCFWEWTEQKMSNGNWAAYDMIDWESPSILFLRLLWKELFRIALEKVFCGEETQLNVGSLGKWTSFAGLCIHRPAFCLLLRRRIAWWKRNLSLSYAAIKTFSSRHLSPQRCLTVSEREMKGKEGKSTYIHIWFHYILLDFIVI